MEVNVIADRPGTLDAEGLKKARRFAVSTIK